MKKTIAFILLILVIGTSLYARRSNDETVANVGYTMPTTTAYNVEDAEQYSKSLSNGIDVLFRNYKSGLFGTYIGFDILWPYENKVFYKESKVSSYFYDDVYDVIHAYEVQLGIYSPLLSLGMVRLPFGAGLKVTSQEAEIAGTLLSKTQTFNFLTLGVALWGKAEVMLSNNIGIYAGVDLSYDFYQYRWTKVDSKETENSQDKLKSFTVAPSLGVSVTF